MSDASAVSQKHLQMFRCVANILECHIVCDVGHTDAWYHDETNFSAFEFLIHDYRIENFFTRELRGQPSGQSESLKQSDDRIALRRPQSSFCNGDGARCHHSKADCFSVQEFRIISGVLNL